MATSIEAERSPLGAEMVKNAVLIAGPTASGKSALALEMAERDKGTIINADSIQVYDVLEVLTARPAMAEQVRAPHALYGDVDPASAHSAGIWLRDAAHAVEQARLAGRRPIFVGGTGLYFRALVEGLSRMPDIPPGTRARWRDALVEIGPAKLHALLAGRDEIAAARIRPTDGQRIVRALEVLESSDRSITEWQLHRGRPLVYMATAQAIVIEPPRAILRERIEARFDRMLAAGALEEAQKVLALGLDPGLPAMKAIGLRELGDVIRGAISLVEARSKAIQATVQYAKRQGTWFRHQLGPEWRRLES